MSDKNEKTNAPAPEQKETYSLNDDRRVKVLSPGALVAKRSVPTAKTKSSIPTPT